MSKLYIHINLYYEIYKKDLYKIDLNDQKNHDSVSF